MGHFNLKRGRYELYNERERREFGQAQRAKERNAIMEKWITVWRLKNDRNWTDASIKKYLGKPTKQNGYNVYLCSLVKEVESTSEFIAWMEKRISKQYKANVVSVGVEEADRIKTALIMSLNPPAPPIEIEPGSLAPPFKVIKSDAVTIGSCDHCKAGGMTGTDADSKRADIAITEIELGRVTFKLCDKCKTSLAKEMLE